jgi:MFS transporter, Spinster family, sphingosine-1-phosphate transporter
MSSRYPIYVLGLMVGINFLNYMDRWVGSAVAPLIQAEFGLNDFSIGLLGSAFTLIYSIGILPFGIWADRGVRKNVIGIGVAIWSLATLLTGLTTNFVQLFLTRAVLGIGEASYYPAGTSLLGDYFPRQKRAMAMSIWSAGSTAGIAAGFAGGALIADAFGWRTAFYVTAAPGLLFAILAFKLREPLRGAAEQVGPKVAHARDASLKAMVDLWRIPTMRWTILSQTAVYFALGANAYWLPTVLTRRFDMSVSAAGTVAGAVIVVGGLIGTLMGGWLADWRRKRSPAADVEVSAVGFVGSAVFVVIALVAPFVIFLPAFLLSVLCLTLFTGPYTAVQQNVVVPTLRASAVTISLLISHVFGDSYAPAAVGLLSDALGSLQQALLVVSPTVLLLGAAFAGLAMRTVHPDTVKMEQSWAARG